MNKYMFYGMGIQALITSIFMKNGIIDINCTQQLIAAILFFGLAIGIFIVESLCKNETRVS